MNAYKQHIRNQKAVPQTAPIPGKEMVRNNAGGYVFQVDQWERLRRFLILGSEGGTYYVTERALTTENAEHVLKCIAEDGARVVAETVAVSDAGRAPKNTPAIFVLALCAARGDEVTRRAALDALPKVCRTGTHLFQFAEFVDGMRGWGRGLRRAISAWYNGHEAHDLAYQAVKYRQREGWSHRDLLRLAHPSPVDEAHDAIYRWITARPSADAARQASIAWSTAKNAPGTAALDLIWAFEAAQRAKTDHAIVRLIRDHDLPREAIPTDWLFSVDVWDALLAKMPMTAMIRNLGVMTKLRLVEAGSDAERLIVSRLRDEKALRKARIHPIAVLSALMVYGRGQGVRGSGEWTPTEAIKRALDEAFYLAFQNVEPANKRFLLALDVSGSMSMGEIAGVPGLTPRMASAALALMTARTEANHRFMAFSNTFMPLKIHADMRLEEAIKAVSDLPFKGTDCALPMIWALENKIPVEVFVVMTDNETWAGQIHPSQALNRYRQETGIDSRLIVVGMTATDFTIADPADRGMLDVVGFDTAAPQVMSDFAAERL